ncbi:hypothetical protein Dsin_016288 [Dipteronia sinensis]|uniref:Uncharacterized protein n=1 Tax=Dipteronia sinensis TaxID=43782 RepID=A0AAE0E5K5_9ROSI|nr:hypothetical protein Dsin_016288 [Dipteronia sinensis]
METPQEKTIHVSETTPFREEDDGFEDYEEGLRSNGCGCFPGLCFRWKKRNNNNGGGGNTYLLHHQQQQQQEQETRESWLVRKAKKVREISELLAGPKWKTFIRRFSVNNSNNNNNYNKKSRMQFHYDPQSYKLNFDDGICREDEEVNQHVDFSARFASPVIGTNRGELFVID